MFTSDHKSKDCNSQQRCRHCHRGHHQSLCDQRPADLPPSAPQDATPPSQSGTTSTTKKGNGNRVILLQTNQAIASNGEPVPVRMLLDNGSQLSYVIMSLQSYLKPIWWEQLHLNTFGNEKRMWCGKDTSTETGIFRSCRNNSRLHTIIDISKFTHLEGLELADNYRDHKSTSIHILIGSDHYWSIVTGNLTAGEHGPVAVSSTLGWLLSGPTESWNCNDIFHSYIIITEGYSRCI